MEDMREQLPPPPYAEWTGPTERGHGEGGAYDENAPDIVRFQKIGGRQGSVQVLTLHHDDADAEDGVVDYGVPSPSSEEGHGEYEDDDRGRQYMQERASSEIRSTYSSYDPSKLPPSFDGSPHKILPWRREDEETDDEDNSSLGPAHRNSLPPPSRKASSQTPALQLQPHGVLNFGTIKRRCTYALDVTLRLVGPITRAVVEAHLVIDHGDQHVIASIEQGLEEERRIRNWRAQSAYLCGPQKKTIGAGALVNAVRRLRILVWVAVPMKVNGHVVLSLRDADDEELNQSPLNTITIPVHARVLKGGSYEKRRTKGKPATNDASLHQLGENVRLLSTNPPAPRPEDGIKRCRLAFGQDKMSKDRVPRNRVKSPREHYAALGILNMHHTHPFLPVVRTRSKESDKDPHDTSHLEERDRNFERRQKWEEWRAAGGSTDHNHSPDNGSEFNESQKLLYSMYASEDDLPSGGEEGAPSTLSGSRASRASTSHTHSRERASRGNDRNASADGSNLTSSNMSEDESYSNQLATSQLSDARTASLAASSTLGDLPGVGLREHTKLGRPDLASGLGKKLSSVNDMRLPGAVESLKDGLGDVTVPLWIQADQEAHPPTEGGVQMAAFDQGRSEVDDAMPDVVGRENKVLDLPGPVYEDSQAVHSDDPLKELEELHDDLRESLRVQEQNHSDFVAESGIVEEPVDVRRQQYAAGSLLLGA